MSYQRRIEELNHMRLPTVLGAITKIMPPAIHSPGQSIVLYYTSWPTTRNLVKYITLRFGPFFPIPNLNPIHAYKSTQPTASSFR